MKKLITMMIILLAAMAASAQVAGGNVKIKELSTIEEKDSVTVMFTAQIGRNAVAKHQTYVFTPILTNGEYRVSLTPIVIEGGKSRTSNQRKAWAAGQAQIYLDALHSTNGQNVEYICTVEAQSWMNGGKLGVEGVLAGCCSYKVDPMVIVAENLKTYENPEPIEVVTEFKVFKPKTIADSLSAMFPFVIPESMFDPEDPYKIYEDEREKSMIVYFRQAKYNIDANYLDNEQTLINLTATIEMILGETNSNVERVVVAGFASPEGSFAFNDRLAFDRAVAVKYYLITNTNLKDEQLWVYNGSVDWRGLRMFVEKSDMPERQMILDIIDNTPLTDKNVNEIRLSRLQALANGRPYRYMLENFFPLLRNGAFIKVYYSNKIIE